MTKLKVLGDLKRRENITLSNLSHNAKRSNMFMKQELLGGHMHNMYEEYLGDASSSCASSS
jgi:hypothetical protein